MKNPDTQDPVVNEAVRLSRQIKRTCRLESWHATQKQCIAVDNLCPTFAEFSEIYDIIYRGAFDLYSEGYIISKTELEQQNKEVNNEL